MPKISSIRSPVSIKHRFVTDTDTNTVDMMVQRRDGPRRLRDNDNDDDNKGH